ncbi:hypothetical protein BURKHO8Y_210622 [Burkholderia sp. 8Y]|uniref:hypothetical protein n=1 Tax=Burkholderia sp. 8Y TaxID=2653133 RepID=UPI0012EFB83B|nr:hypothetical protein [Burkholderia sp. 8Y]VXC45181.1 hypothetical protein BURKHO8Y_210622 [Burkholderia sp. 8Y]
MPLDVDHSNAFVTAVLAFLGGSFSAAVFTYFVSRKRLKVEVDKLTAETAKLSGESDKLNAETAKLKAETEKLVAETDALKVDAESTKREVTELATTVNGLAEMSERVLFDGSADMDGFAVRGQEGRFWEGYGPEARPVSALGRGELRFEPGGVLSIERTNTEGRFELLFVQYSVPGSTSSFIPKNVAMAGRRKIHVQCEAKVPHGQHTLRFVTRNPETGRRFSDTKKTVNSDAWVQIDAYLISDPTQDVQIRIDDEEVRSAPSSVQLRNIRIFERVG